MGTQGAIAVDWDGWDSADTWASGAQIRVGATTYTENTYTARVYEITRCKGDMNNDGYVNWHDIDPFVAAQNISDPEVYEAAYPGLGGSMLFHADMNCDGVADWRDIDPFVARQNGCCWEECGPCPEEDAGGYMPPTELAEVLAAAIAPERYDVLLDLIEQLLINETDGGRQAYWASVYEALTQ